MMSIMRKASPKSFGYVYRITNLVTGAAYIGATTQRPSNRWAHHRNAARQNPKYLIHQSMAHFGVSLFRFEVLVTADDAEELTRLEQELILSLKTHVRFGGYNLFGGGAGSYDASEETRARMAAARSALWNDPNFVERVVGPQRGRKRPREHVESAAAARVGKPLTATHRAALSAAQKGRVVTKEQRAKISLSLTGRKAAPEAVAKRAAALKGHAVSEATRAKLSAALTGRVISEEQRRRHSELLKGRKPSEETRAKLSEGQTRRWAKWRKDRGRV